MASEEQLRANYRRWIEAINSKDLALIDRTCDEVLAEDFFWHHPAVSDPTQGPDVVKRFIRPVFQAHPDFRITIEDLMAEGDKLAARWTIHRTDPESGKPQRMVNIQMLHAVGAKFAESWELTGRWEDNA